MTILRNVFTSDVAAPGWLRRGIHDEILNAVGPGKCLVAGLVWSGDLRPRLDAALAAMEPLANGLTPGRVLHAEPVPATLDLGRRWAGDLRARIAAAATDGEPDGKADVGEVLNALGQLQAVMGQPDPDMGAIGDGLKRLRRAADRVKATSDASFATSFIRSSRENARRAFDAMRRSSQPVVVATKDDAGEVRDQLHAANHATHMRDRVRALNAAAAAFWRERGNAGPSAPPVGRPGPTSIAEMNAAARRFWAGRS